MKYRVISAKDIYDIYDRKNNRNQSITKIKSIKKMTYTGVAVVLSTVDKYLTRFSDLKSPRKNYTDARDLIIGKMLEASVTAPGTAKISASQRVEDVPVPVAPAPVTMREASFMALDAAILNLNNAIVMTVDNLVREKTEEIVEENKRLNALVNSAKLSSAVRVLQKKYQG